MDEEAAEPQQSTASIDKCAYIQEAEPPEQAAPATSSLIPMEKTVGGDGEVALPSSVGDSSVNSTTGQSEPAASSSQTCPTCPNSRVSMFKYGSRLGEKRLKCSSCSQWFGDVVKGSVVDNKSDMRPPPAKISRRSKSSSQDDQAKLEWTNPIDVLFSPSTSNITSTSVQTDADDLFIANLKMQMTDSTSFDQDDVISLRRKLKMAQVMLRESRTKISVVEKERNDAYKLLKTFHSAIYQLKVGFHSDMQRLQEDQSFLANQYATYLKELARGVDKERQAFDTEKTRVKLMFDHCETKRRNLKAQLECKKEQLKQSQRETAMETRRCDVLTRDVYLATSEAERAKKNLNDKLFLRTNQKCGTCTASERVKDKLTNQIVHLSSEIDELKQQRDQLTRKCEEKDRICQMLTKTNERMQFEVNALNNDNKRMLADISRRTTQEKEEGPPSTPGSGISLGARQNNSQINPSPPSSDQSNEGDGAVSASPNLQLKKELNTPSEPPPPPPSTDPDDCVAADAESQRDAEKKASSIDWDVVLSDKEWLRSQLEGCWELLVWYRKELKGATEQKIYFADRLEEETEAMENALEEKEAELQRVQHALSVKSENYDKLLTQVSQSTHVTSFFKR